MVNSEKFEEARNAFSAINPALKEARQQAKGLAMQWMTLQKVFSAFLVFTAMAAWSSVTIYLLAAEQKVETDQSLSRFMRKKLDASSQVLEGLTLEDSDLILKGANSLLELSKAEKWKMIVDSEYREFNAEFRSSVRKLIEAAEKKNFDNVALQWFDTTKSCIECHREIRHTANKK